jgi:hypothetical protein
VSAWDNTTAGSRSGSTSSTATSSRLTRSSWCCHRPGGRARLASQELGVNETTLCIWVRIEHDLHAGQAAGGLDRDERAAARVELALLRVERDLPKRTVAFWVKESTP